MHSTSEEIGRDRSKKPDAARRRILWLAVTGIALLLVVLFLLWILRQIFFSMDVSLLLRVPSWAIPFVNQSIAIGVLTMAVIQMVRMTYPVRGIFHGRWIRVWLRAGTLTKSQPKDESTATARQKHPVADAVSELVNLAVTSDSRALFDLSIEQLCGQIAAAIDPVLDAPLKQLALLRGLAGDSGTDEVEAYVEAWGAWQDRREKSKSMPTSPQASSLGNAVSEPNVGPVSEPNVRAVSEPNDDDMRFLDARNAIARRMQRNIDGFQILISTNWRRMLRIGALIIAGVLSCYGTAGITDLRSRVFFVLAGGIVGGFVATVARDIVAGIEKLRR